MSLHIHFTTVSAEFEFIMIIFTERLANTRATFYGKIWCLKILHFYINTINTKEFITRFRVVIGIHLVENPL